MTTTGDAEVKLSERLEAKADEMDRRLGVTNTQSLLREAAALARRVEDAPEGRVDMICAADAVVVDELPEQALLALNKQRVRIVPEDGNGGGGHG